MIHRDDRDVKETDPGEVMTIKYLLSSKLDITSLQTSSRI